MRGTPAKSPNIPKLILFAISLVILVCLLRRLIFTPCPRVHVIRKTVVVSRDGRQLGSDYTLLKDDEHSALLQSQLKQEQESRGRPQGVAGIVDDAVVSCDIGQLKAPSTVLDAKCGDKCNLLTCGNLLADNSKDEQFTAKLHKQV